VTLAAFFAQYPYSRLLTLRCVCLIFLSIVCGCASENSETPVPESETAEISARERLGKLKYQRGKLLTGISRLADDQEQIVLKLREAGVESTDDLKNVSGWKLYAKELKDVVSKKHRLSQQVDKYNAAITRVEIILRSRNREAKLQRSKLSDSELEELSRIFHEADDELSSQWEVSPAEDVELEALLKEQLDANHERDMSRHKEHDR